MLQGRRSVPTATPGVVARLVRVAPHPSPGPVPFDDRLRAAARARLAAAAPVAVDGDGLRAAAVCVALVEGEGGDAAMVLCRRGGVGSHRHQWGLPGGSVDVGETAEQAAVRELAEEVGLEAVEVLGRMDDYVTRSGFHLSPFVVWCPAQRPVVASPREIASVHRVPLAHVGREGSAMWERIPQSDRPVLSVHLGRHHVYAPTAAVIHQFAEWVLRDRRTSVADVEEPVFAWR